MEYSIVSSEFVPLEFRGIHSIQKNSEPTRMRNLDVTRNLTVFGLLIGVAFLVGCSETGETTASATITDDIGQVETAIAVQSRLNPHGEPSHQRKLVSSLLRWIPAFAGKTKVTWKGRSSMEVAVGRLGPPKLRLPG